MSIDVEGYSKVYGDTAAVADVTFSVAPGEVLGLVGPNGAGKTTTLRALAGILQPTKGRLVIAGHDVVREPIAAKARLAYVPDDPHLFDRLTVWEHFRFTAAAYRLRDWQDLAEQLLMRLELVEKRNALASELSRGMRQKTAVGCACLHRPRALLLDEPLTGLDPRGIRTMKDLIRETCGRRGGRRRQLAPAVDGRGPLFDRADPAPRPGAAPRPAWPTCAARRRPTAGRRRWKSCSSA